MRNTIIALAALGAVAGCTTAEQSAVVGGVGGAAIGGLATGRASGALIGAGAGAVAGYLVGKAASPGYCLYEDRRTGRRYEARC
ncbi:glycine zipper domain-containing protein [Shinella sumterensis]|uniref:glycine zipper domain-containing protein n=1 Tax=Shinella sumterensis TaxID=1967501 RepID=UPI003F85E6C3